VLQQAAYEQWWTRRGERIARTRLRRAGVSKRDQDDLLQECAIAAFDALLRYHSKAGPFTPWATLMMESYLSRWRRRGLDPADASDAQPAAGRETEEETVASHEDDVVNSLWFASLDLPAIVNLRAEGASWEEIQEGLEIPTSASALRRQYERWLRAYAQRLRQSS
jgi:DNA-directed RNA polymerase specialized sigma24 family protein